MQFCVVFIGALEIEMAVILSSNLLHEQFGNRGVRSGEGENTLLLLNFFCPAFSFLSTSSCKGTTVGKPAYLNAKCLIICTVTFK